MKPFLTRIRQWFSKALEHKGRVAALESRVVENEHLLGAHSLVLSREGVYDLSQTIAALKYRIQTLEHSCSITDDQIDALQIEIRKLQPKRKAKPTRKPRKKS